MYSNVYYQTIDRVKQYHLKKEVYSGVATVGYHSDIKALVEKHNAKTLLDYGCGKAFHYYNEEKYKEWFNGASFDKWLGLDSFYLFDPCVDEYSKHPEQDAKFDGIIAIQSLTGVPDADFPTVVNQLMQMTTKFCFIGNRLKKGKSSKGDHTLVEYFKADRLDPKWWEEQFNGWQGSELVLKFIE